MKKFFNKKLIPIIISFLFGVALTIMFGNIIMGEMIERSNEELITKILDYQKNEKARKTINQMGE